MGFFRQSHQETEEEKGHRLLDEYHAWAQSPESTRRNNVFDVEFDAWIDRLRIARDQTGSKVVTAEILGLAGEHPVVDARGLNPTGVEIESRATTGAYVTVLNDLAHEVRQAGGPAGFWEDLGRYISDHGFEVLHDSVVPATPPASVEAERLAPIELQEHPAQPWEIQLDTPPTCGTVSKPQQQWAADPSGRNEWRYWDGVRWTDHVASAGILSRDSID